MKRYYIELIAALLILSAAGLMADELDDLLDGSPKGNRVVESERIRAEWARALDLLAQRKYEQGIKRLDDLATVKDFVTPRRRDFVAITRRVIEFENWLEGVKGLSPATRRRAPTRGLGF